MKFIGASLKSVLFLLCLGAASCGYGKTSIQEDHLLSPHNILIVPYKTAPIPIRFSVDPAFGSADVYTEKVLTEDWRQHIVNQLNNDSNKWSPSLALAEECSALLSGSTTIKFGKSKIADMTQIPGIKPPETRDSYTYFAEENKGWKNSISEFLKNDHSLSDYKKNNNPEKFDWFLEVYLIPVQYVIANNMDFLFVDTFNYGFALRLSDLTNKTIAAGFRWDKQDMPDKSKPVFETPEQDFREFIRKSCAIPMYEMGLL